MKLSKSFMKKLLILVLTAFVILPIILMILGYPKNIMEGYENGDSINNKYTISEIDISGETIGSVTGSSGDRIYCIGDAISTCTNNTDGTYDVCYNSSSGLYKYACYDSSGNAASDSHVVCENSYFEKNSTTQLSFSRDISNNAYDTEYIIKSAANTSGTIQSDDVSINYFTDVYTSQPFKYDDDNAEYVLLYSTKNSDYTTIKKSSACYLNDTNESCATYLSSLNSTTDDNIDKPPAPTPSPEPIKEECSSDGITQEYCVADFGAQVGDKLCCGQTGVVQKEDRVCPYSKPICSGFKCGSKWGICVENKEQEQEQEQQQPPSQDGQTSMGTDSQQQPPPSQ